MADFVLQITSKKYLDSKIWWEDGKLSSDNPLLLHEIILNSGSMFYKMPIPTGDTVGFSINDGVRAYNAIRYNYATIALKAPSDEFLGNKRGVIY